MECLQELLGLIWISYETGSGKRRPKRLCRTTLSRLTGTCSVIHNGGPSTDWLTASSEKLQTMMVDSPTVSWITDYLTHRSQFACVSAALSDVVVSDVGAPQGTALSPFLFTVYTSDFQSNPESAHLQKFSDDSAEVGCISGGQSAGGWLCGVVWEETPAVERG